MLLLPPPKKDWRYDCYEAQNKQKGCTLVLSFAKTNSGPQFKPVVPECMGFKSRAVILLPLPAYLLLLF